MQSAKETNKNSLSRRRRPVKIDAAPSRRLAAISARHPNQNDQFGVGSFLMLFFLSRFAFVYISPSRSRCGSLPASLDQIRIMLSSRVTTLNSTFEHHYFYLIFSFASSHSSAPCDFGIAEQKHKTDTQRLFFLLPASLC